MILDLIPSIYVFPTFLIYHIGLYFAYSPILKLLDLDSLLLRFNYWTILILCVCFLHDGCFTFLLCVVNYMPLNLKILWLRVYLNCLCFLSYYVSLRILNNVSMDHHTPSWLVFNQLLLHCYFVSLIILSDIYLFFKLSHFLIIVLRLVFLYYLLLLMYVYRILILFNINNSSLRFYYISILILDNSFLDYFSFPILLDYICLFPDYSAIISVFNYYGVILFTDPLSIKINNLKGLN